MLATLKQYFFDFETPMSRRQFWPSFIGGNIAALLLVIGMFSCLFAYVDKHDSEPRNFTQSITINGDNSVLNQYLFPDYKVQVGEELRIEQVCKLIDDKAHYTTTKTITAAGAEPIITISHEPFSNQFISFFGRIPLLSHIKLAGLIIALDLVILLTTCIAIRLLRNCIARLRDANLSPWLMLLYIAGGLGQLALLILFCFPSKAQMPPIEPQA